MDRRLLEAMNEVRQAVRTDEVLGYTKMTPASAEMLERALIRAEVDPEQSADLALRFAEAQKTVQKVTFQILRAVER